MDKVIEGTVKVKFTKDGFEIPDSKPMELPVGFDRPPTMRELIQRMIKVEVSQMAEQDGLETFEEADDFDTGDEAELSSPYELDDEQIKAGAEGFEEERPKEKPDPQPKLAGEGEGGDKKPPTKVATDTPSEPKE